MLKPNEQAAGSISVDWECDLEATVERSAQKPRACPVEKATLKRPSCMFARQQVHSPCRRAESAQEVYRIRC